MKVSIACCHDCHQNVFSIEVGRVPGDYSVSGGYCTTRHYPDLAGYYFKIWPDPDPGNFSRFLRLLTIPHAVKRKVGIYFVLRLSLMHDTVASRVTDNCPLGPLRGRTDGNLSLDGLISHLTRRITMCVLTDEAITQRDTLLLLQRLLMLLFNAKLGHLLTELDNLCM